MLEEWYQAPVGVRSEYHSLILKYALVSCCTSHFILTSFLIWHLPYMTPFDVSHPDQTVSKSRGTQSHWLSTSIPLPAIIHTSTLIVSHRSRLKNRHEPSIQVFYIIHNALSCHIHLFIIHHSYIQYSRAVSKPRTLRYTQPVLTKQTNETQPIFISSKEPEKKKRLDSHQSKLLTVPPSPAKAR